MKVTKMRAILFMGVWLGVSVASYADCTTQPTSKAFESAISQKSVETAKSALQAYEAEVQKYLETCGNSKEMFEKTSVQVLTYKDMLADMEHDLSTASQNAVDCSNVPKVDALKSALGTADAGKIEAAYTSYKQGSEAYLDSCASHESYEFVYEDALFYDEEYAKWKKK